MKGYASRAIQIRSDSQDLKREVIHGDLIYTVRFSPRGPDLSAKQSSYFLSQPSILGWTAKRLLLHPATRRDGVSTGAAAPWSDPPKLGPNAPNSMQSGANLYGIDGYHAGGGHTGDGAAETPGHATRRIHRGVHTLVDQILGSRSPNLHSENPGTVLGARRGL